MKNEQDEKMASLLSKAFEEEELTVSEELIQKTLKRVAEEKKDEKQRNTGRKSMNRVLRFSEMAAAAVLVMTIGILGVRGIYSDRNSEDKAAGGNNIVASKPSDSGEGVDKRGIFPEYCPPVANEKNNKESENGTCTSNGREIEQGMTAANGYGYPESDGLPTLELSKENQLALKELGYTVLYTGEGFEGDEVSEECDSSSNDDALDWNLEIAAALKSNPPRKDQMDFEITPDIWAQTKCWPSCWMKTGEGTLWLCKKTTGYLWFLVKE